jgi:hypothetical protein
MNREYIIIRYPILWIALFQNIQVGNEIHKQEGRCRKSYRRFINLIGGKNWKVKTLKEESWRKKSR